MSRNRHRPWMGLKKQAIRGREIDSDSVTTEAYSPVGPVPIQKWLVRTMLVEYDSSGPGLCHALNHIRAAALDRVGYNTHRTNGSVQPKRSQ